ncbi:MAG: c-type cytochrome [Saprospiraceae bacterium]|nr:c-type cytochrome [Saprospiraceae bacterium]
MIKNYKYYLVAGLSVLTSVSYAGSSAETKSNAIQFGGLHSLLAILLILLLIPIIISASTFMKLVKKSYADKLGKSSTHKLSGLFLVAATENAATTAVADSINWSNIDWGLWVMLLVAVVEIFLIIFFNLQTQKIIDLEKASSYVGEAEEPQSWLSDWWDRINSFKPLHEEGRIDTGHNYDGIRELDNITPPWFTAAFIGTIIIAGVYMYRYHIAKSAPLQLAELKIEMDLALKEKAEYMLTQESSVDENNVTYLDEANRLEGQVIFELKCAVCHEKHGGSKAGGVGPNLTDKYWLHGGSLKDIFYTIKYGWPEKGMIAWADQMSPKEMAQVSSYIKAMQGTNPAGAKEPQGDEFVEAVTNTSTESVSKDTIQKK